MSVLLYLSDGHSGGETIFYPSGEASAEDAVKVAPRKGSVLCFYHGHHPLSALHEGAPLAAGSHSPKYVIRTDVIYATEARFDAGEWTSSNVARAMMAAASAT